MANRRAAGRETFGLLLKEWRRVRRKSQLTVALEAEVSPRHLSFVESGRSVPSREMVSTLADALEIPLRERNALLLAAGYAPLHPEGALASDQMAQIRRALDRLLRHQEPYPAVVLDRQWNILQTNRSAPKFFGFFIDLSRQPDPPNLLRSMFDPSALRPWVANWDQVAETLVQRVFGEAVAGVPDPRVLGLLDEVQKFGGVPPLRPRALAGEMPFLPVRLTKGSLALSFFSLVTTVGAPADITAQELRIESLFPADEVTERFARENLTAE
jgi:transcriptional regulator with XRE-family HTH domain